LHFSLPSFAYLEALADRGPAPQRTSSTNWRGIQLGVPSQALQSIQQNNQTLSVSPSHSYQAELSLNSNQSAMSQTCLTLATIKLDPEPMIKNERTSPRNSFSGEWQTVGKVSPLSSQPNSNGSSAIQSPISREDSPNLLEPTGSLVASTDTIKEPPRKKSRARAQALVSHERQFAIINETPSESSSGLRLKPDPKDPIKATSEKKRRKIGTKQIMVMENYLKEWNLAVTNPLSKANAGASGLETAKISTSAQFIAVAAKQHRSIQEIAKGCSQLQEVISNLKALYTELMDNAWNGNESVANRCKKMCHSAESLEKLIIFYAHNPLDITAEDRAPYQVLTEQELAELGTPNNKRHRDLE
jgi:hypothetical protein